MAEIEDMAKENGTRRVFFGHTNDDVYIAFGRHWGPGEADVPNNVAAHLEPSIKRAQLERHPDLRIDPSKPSPRRNVSLTEASDAELRAILEERERQKSADATINALRPEEMASQSPQDLVDASNAAGEAAKQVAGDAAKENAEAREAADKAAAKRAAADKALVDDINKTVPGGGNPVAVPQAPATLPPLPGTPPAKQ
jgi:hypothetical protein